MCVSLTESTRNSFPFFQIVLMLSHFRINKVCDTLSFDETSENIVYKIGRMQGILSLGLNHC